MSTGELIPRTAEMEPAARLLLEQEIEAVRVEWCDLHGASRGKHLPRSRFLAALRNGTTFSSAAMQMDLRGETVDLSGPDAPAAWVNLVAVPDLATLQPYHLEPHTARCLADLYHVDGTPVSLSPRRALQQVVSQVQAMGYEAEIGIELEFYVLDGAAIATPGGPAVHPSGRQVYRMQRSEAEARFLEPLRRQLEEAGIRTDAFCAEDGPGQFEIILDHGPAVAAADAAFLARNLVKEQAARHGLVATFLSRPFEAFSGSGSHIHQSLWSSSGEPLFRLAPGQKLEELDPAGDTLFSRYLSGQLRHFREACALFLPTINAYKRVALRQPEPLCIDWAFEERSAAFRVLGNGSDSLHLENRAIAGEANPYLSVAASLAAGLEPVSSAAAGAEPARRTWENAGAAGGPAPAAADVPASGLPAPTRHAESFPASLPEALELLTASEPLRRWLGSDLIDLFLALKWSEVRRFERAITDWELQEYLHSL